MKALELRDVTCGYGRLPIVSNVTFEVDAQQVLVVLGPNGCGKSTLLKTIVGVLTGLGGSVVVEGRDLTRLTAARRAKCGLAWVPSGGRLFGELTVRENLSIGAGGRLSAADWDRRFDLVRETFPTTETILERPAFALSGGEQQMVAVGRALMAEPKVLLLDEPSLGLAPALVIELMDAIDQLRARGLSAVIVEQNATAGLRVADRAVVLGRGRVELNAPAAVLREDGRLLARYLTNAPHEENTSDERVPAVKDL